MSERKIKFSELKAGDKVHYKDPNDAEVERQGTIIFAKPIKFEDKDSISIGIKSPQGAAFSLIRPPDEEIMLVDKLPKPEEPHGITLDA